MFEPEVKSTEEEITNVLNVVAVIVSAVISFAVTFAVTFNEFKVASDPLTISFFQFGILLNYGWLLITKSTSLSGL
jgi:hypothetical protein